MQRKFGNETEPGREFVLDFIDVQASWEGNFRLIKRGIEARFERQQNSSSSALSAGSFLPKNFW